MTSSTSPINGQDPKRVRRTKIQMGEFRRALLDIAEEYQPCTVRQIYYIGIGQLYDKDSSGKRKNYSSVVTELGTMREDGTIPWEWIVDLTRTRQKPYTNTSVQQALNGAAYRYRRDPWEEQDRIVEVWCESDSISSVLRPITGEFCVGLSPCRGQSSKGFINNAVEIYQDIGKPVTVLYVGDWDPSGLAIDRSVKERMTRYGNGELDLLDLQMKRIAVSPEQIETLNLVSHEANTDDKNYLKFTGFCNGLNMGYEIAGSPFRLTYDAYEVEAIPPQILKDTLRREIENRIEWETWDEVLAEEEEEKNKVREIANSWSN